MHHSGHFPSQASGLPNAPSCDRRLCDRARRTHRSRRDSIRGRCRCCPAARSVPPTPPGKPDAVGMARRQQHPGAVARVLLYR
jgi:hypothetical protein